jgi:hypothetical protein
VCALAFLAGCGGGGGGEHADAAPGPVTDPAGAVPERVAVALPDSLQVSHRCAVTSSQGEVEELTKHIELTQEVAVAQIRVVDVLIGAVEDSPGDDVYSEAGAFLVEVSDQLAADIADDVADYPALAENPPPAGFLFESPRFCLRRNQPAPFTTAVYLDRYGFAEGAGCDDLDRYMTRLEWNQDRTLFRIRVNRYRGFYPVPNFNYFYDEDNPLPEGAGDHIDGHATYTYDAAADREQFRLAVLQSFVDPADELDSTYELTGTLQGCGADECLGFHVALSVIGTTYDRDEIYAGMGDTSGVVHRSLVAQRAGDGGAYFGDWQTIVDGAGCVLWQREIQADGYGPWEGEGTGDPTSAPFYDQVVTTGIDYNTAAIDFSALDGRPDSSSDPPRLFVLVRGGGDPASDADVLGVGYDHFFGTVLTRYLYWGTEAEVGSAEVYEEDWDDTAHLPRYAPITGSLSLAP